MRAEKAVSQMENLFHHFGPDNGISIPTGQKHKHKATVLTDTVKVVLPEDV